ncbi:hypothetical protein TNCV_4885831 [Trichonephila clavipes]|uniref:Uncharacterized protein n=1 Tax=Trichonephila clavipes TaxID=2585209 RepID=A0A8X6V5F5_TRICX|nr:hypothetical protein TNCV_4885831 [Trichonephila clavipes]
MPNSPFQMIPYIIDWRQIWGSGRPRKGSNSTETVLLHPCSVRRSIVLLKTGSREPLYEWQHMWFQNVMDIPLSCHGTTDQYWGVAVYCGQWHPIPSRQLWERCVAVKQRQD